MRRFLFPLLTAVLAVCMTACGGSDDESHPTIEKPQETTQEDAKVYVLKGYKNPVQGYVTLKPDGYSDVIYIKEQSLTGKGYTFQPSTSNRLDAMKQPDTEGEWGDAIAIGNGKSCWIRHQEGSLYNYLKLRIMEVEGNDVTVEYITTDITSPVAESKPEENVNANAPTEGRKYVTDYSMPHLDASLYYVEHVLTVDKAEVLNYAYQWDNAMKHTTWVAFYFDKVTNGDVTGRTDAWDVDPLLPVEMQTNNSHHTSDGFDRGHLVASEDRVFSKEANQQTFYFSNMSPQFNSFNGGYWITFENKVRKWARSGTFDKLYVTKGGSLRQLLKDNKEGKGQDGQVPATDANGFTIHGLACPKYYFMALLGEKEGRYQAIGFWVEHRDDYGYDNDKQAPVSVMKETAVSIDRLEELTGIDFFCNLPDSIEDEVEKEYTADGWSW